MLDENRPDYKVLNDDVVIFRRHNRYYRLSNLANNWLPWQALRADQRQHQQPGLRSRRPDQSALFSQSHPLRQVLR